MDSFAVCTETCNKFSSHFIQTELYLRLSPPPPSPPSLQAMACITSESRLPDDLVKLLCALQSALFFWCHRHITSKDEEVQKTAKTVLHDCTLVWESCWLGREELSVVSS